MKIAVVGDGPAGLAFALSMRSLQPDWSVQVWGRGSGSDRGYGIVLPARAVGSIESWDPVIGESMAARGVRWSRIDVRYNGATVTSAGHEYLSIERGQLLSAMRSRCVELGVDFRSAQIPSRAELAADVELIVAADGVNSVIRAQCGEELGPDLRTGRNRFLWATAPIRLEAFTFHVFESRFGTVILHVYPYRPDRSVVIIELASDSQAAVGELLGEAADALGAPVEAADSDCRRFTAISLARWSTANVTVIGDAAHATHFSIGSGTKMAIDDGRTLAQCLAAAPVARAQAEYESIRRSPVAALQQAAVASSDWLEQIDRHRHCGAEEFANRLLSRAGRPVGGDLVHVINGDVAANRGSRLRHV